MSREKIGRNDPCPCGSGKKYKQCCGHQQNAPAEVARPTDAEIMQALQVAVDHQMAGRLIQAQALYRRVLQFSPRQPDALHMLGVIAHQEGRPQEAVELIRAALALSPDFAEAHANLALALTDLGRLDEALLSSMRALRLDENAVTKSGFVRCLKNVRFTKAQPEINALVARAMAEAWDSPPDLIRTAISLAVLSPALHACLERVAASWPERLPSDRLFGPDGPGAIAGEPLLRALMDTLPISDLRFERFLTTVRLIMLDEVAKEAPVEDKLLGFYCALARQCLITEYVFAQTPEEQAKVHALRVEVVSRLAARTAVPPAWLAALGAYVPLASLEGSAALLELSWPAPVEALLTQQLREPAEERALAQRIPRLTDIDEGVSRLVREQYEENPYPRWIKVPRLAEAVDPVANFRHFPDFQAERFPGGQAMEAMDILIAGCGTGKQAIHSAQQFRGAKVLAIDLSLRSLGYASRKTIEMGLTNIEYAQADIMKLGSLAQRFDLIESVGVLHHLADPLAGWQVLRDKLKPGGLMFIALYSELARQYVLHARAFIAKHGYTTSPESIRKFREDFTSGTNAAEADVALLTSKRDFYSMSGCRDLAFHVQEQRYSPLALKAMLEALNLRFLGFGQLPRETVELYEARFPDDRTKTNLDNWQAFEIDHPHTFTGMYMLWAQDRG